jgi:hypothetical protein
LIGASALTKYFEAALIPLLLVYSLVRRRTELMSVEDLSELDLSYTPPLSSPWDPVQLAAQQWCRANSSAMSRQPLK